MSDYFAPRTPPGTVFSNSSDKPTLTDAYQQGRDDERTALVPILTDLIAELRDDAQSARVLGGDLMNRVRVLSQLDRAEARLREVDDE